MIINNLGNKIKIARVELHKTQQDLAKYLKVTNKAISHYELNKINPSLENLVKISIYLKKPINYFLSSKVDNSTLKSEFMNLKDEIKELNKKLSNIEELLKNK